MNIPRYLQQVMVSIDQAGVVSALVKVAPAAVPPIEPCRVTDVEMTHELRAIRLSGLNEQVKMVIHHSKGVHGNKICIYRAGQQIKKAKTITIVNVY